MRIAFYAPMKAPNHPVPSGERGMARLLMAALSAAGHQVTLASTLRTWDPGTSPGRAERLAALGGRVAARLIARWSADPPDLWFTYHLYHKAPDWLGPPVSRRFGIPYVVAEASHAARQADGPFAFGHRAAAAAIRQAAALVNLAGHDAAGVLSLINGPERLVRLPPFLDTAPFAAAADARDRHRADLAARLGLPPGVPWLLAVGMMRDGDKERSYAVLADALPRVRGDWRLLIVGDGPARPRVEARFGGALAPRTRFLGQRDPSELAALCAAADLMVWPAINEAYGMALLEAQAAGLPVVAGATGGVPDVVRAGVSGLLPTVGDPAAFAAAVSDLLANAPRRRAMAVAARRIACDDHDLSMASRRLGALVHRLALVGKP